MMSSPVSKVYTRNALDHETIKDFFFPSTSSTNVCFTTEQMSVCVFQASGGKREASVGGYKCVKGRPPNNNNIQ